MNSQSRLHNQSNNSQYNQGAFNSTSERFRDYDINAKKSVVGPGSYNDQFCFNKLRSAKCKAKMVLSQYGKETGQPYYVQVGNSIMIDPTFFDTKTKKMFVEKSMKESQYTHFQKEAIVEKLVSLQKLKQYRSSSQTDIGSHTLQNRLGVKPRTHFNSSKRPSTQLSLHQNSSQNTPKHSKFNKVSSKSTLLINQTQRSQKELSLESGRSHKNKINNSLIKRPQTQFMGRKSSRASNKIQGKGQQFNQNNSPPHILRKKKNEILEIIQQNENSLQNQQNLTDDLNGIKSHNNQKQNQSYISNLRSTQADDSSQYANQSILVMSSMTQDLNNGMIGGQSQQQIKSNSQIREKLKQQGKSHQLSEDMNGSNSTNTTQYGFYQSQHLHDSINKSNQLHSLQEPHLTQNHTKSTLSNYKKGISNHRKSNSLHENLINSNRNQRELEQNGREDMQNISSRMRDFDKSFYLLKMYANPYHQKQKLHPINNGANQTILQQNNQNKITLNGGIQSNSGIGFHNQIRKVNTEAVNWIRPNNNL